MSGECIDFMKRCLKKEPYLRVKLESLINHPFVNNNELEGYFNVELYERVERLF